MEEPSQSIEQAVIRDMSKKRPLFRPARAAKRKVQNELHKATKKKNYQLQMTVIELRQEVARLEYKCDRLVAKLQPNDRIALLNDVAAEIEAQEQHAAASVKAAEAEITKEAKT